MVDTWWPPLERQNLPPVFCGGFEYECQTGIIGVQQCLKAGCQVPTPHTHPQVLSWNESGLDRCWVELDSDDCQSPPSFFYPANNWDLLTPLFPKSYRLPTWLSPDKLHFLGDMTGRPGNPTKAVFSPQRGPLAETLETLNWPGDLSYVQQVQADIFPGQEYRLSIDLFDSQLGPKIGVELFQARDLIAPLKRRGILPSCDLEVLRKWPSIVTPSGWDWPLPAIPPRAKNLEPLLAFKRAVSHFKLVFGVRKELFLKIYLAFSLERLSPQEICQIGRDAPGTGASRHRQIEPVIRSEIEAYLNDQISLADLQPGTRRRAFEIGWWMRLLRAQHSF